MGQIAHGCNDYGDFCAILDGQYKGYRPDFLKVLLNTDRFFSPAAVTTIIEILNMEALGGTENPTSTSLHTLQLSGLVPDGGGKVLVRARMTYLSGQGVTLELGVRAENEAVVKLVTAAIGG